MLLISVCEVVLNSDFDHTSTRDHLDDYGVALLQEFMELFPTHSLTTLLKGYFIYMQIPISEGARDDDNAVEDTDVGYDMVLVNTIFPQPCLCSSKGV